jgi:hypothetical protein
MIVQREENIHGRKATFPSIYRANNIEKEAQNLIPVML